MDRIKELIRAARALYATKHLRRQWVRKTLMLEASGRHAKFTGGFTSRDAEFLNN